MPVRGVNEVKRNLNRLIKHISEDRAPRVLTEVLLIGEAYATMLTPVDTANLINSRYHSLSRNRNGWVGRLGYTASYAAAVHAASGKLKGQQREDFGESGFGGGTGRGSYWDPDAEPGFLVKGFERDGLSDIRTAIIRGMKL